jgi:hypothetical protein
VDLVIKPLCEFLKQVNVGNRNFLWFFRNKLESSSWCQYTFSFLSLSSEFRNTRLISNRSWPLLHPY